MALACVLLAGNPLAAGAPAAASASAASPHAAITAAAPPVRQAADPPVPFSCAIPTFFLSQGNGVGVNPQQQTQLWTGVYGAGTATISTLGTPWRFTYNALGFDPVDGFLYAVQYPVPAPASDGQNHLLQIDSNGTTTDLGALPGLPFGAGGPNTGAFDAAGDFWVTNTNSTSAFEIDVTSSPPAVIGSVTLSRGWGGYDWSDSNGFLWGMSGTTIYRLNLSTGTVTTFPAPSQVVTGTFGATWTYSNGDLGFSENSTGRIYRISVANPAAASPAFTVLAQYAGPSSSNNDGAACLAPDTDLAITKTAPALTTQGGSVTWSLTVTNNGPGNSSGYAVSDTIPAGVTNVAVATPGCVVTGSQLTCSEGALSSGASATFMFSGTVTVAAGSCVTNTASVSGNETDPNPANNSSSATTCVVGIGLTKSANTSSFSAPGTAITYTYTVTNPSTVPLTGVTVVDEELGTASCPSTALAAGGSMHCTATHTTDQADVDAGGITNAATATGTAPDGTVVTDRAVLTVPAIDSPALTLTKTANVASFDAVGAEIGYHYLVTNTGNETLNPVTVDDPLPGLSGLACSADSVVPGGTITCDATYFTTQADLDAGHRSNLATATGHPPQGPDVTATSGVTVPGIQSPEITVEKSGEPPSYALAGTDITYKYLVKNTGNVTLDPVTLDDTKAGVVADCPSTALGPGEEMTCFATYAVTAGDVDAGSVTNMVTATGTTLTGTSVTDTATATVKLAAQPAIGLAKEPDVSSFDAADQTITYTYVVTNSGNVTLSGITLNDVPLGTVDCPEDVLAAGESMTCTTTHTTTQDDVDHGEISNTATVTGVTPAGGTVDETADATVTADQLPGIAVAKTANPPSFNAAGVPLRYSYLVTNTGNVTLTSVTLGDDKLGPISTCPQTTLAPGADMTCTASTTYATTQDDVDDGGVTNTATVTGTPPDGDRVTADSPLTVPAVQNPALTVDKTVSPTSFATAGATLSYSYTVTNTGNVTLAPVTLTDSKVGQVCSVASLAPGGTLTCSATYITIQADLDAGGVTNLATATGRAPDGTTVTGGRSATATATQNPAVALHKSAPYTDFTSAGTTITYRYVIVNAGNVTLHTVNLTDDRLGPVTCPATTVAPRGFVVCTAAYTTTQADVDRGGITNLGTVTAVAPDGRSVSATSPLTIPSVQDPGIRVVKTASVPSFADANTPITYTYVVTNTGNDTLDPVNLTDDRLGPVTCPVTSLAPAAQTTCTATHTTTQADVDSGGITNTATATGTPPPSAGPVTDTSTVDVPAVQAPAIGITKSTATTTFDTTGAEITYDYLVTNSGNVTLDPVTVADNRLGTIGCPATTLGAGAHMTCTATTATTQADLDAGGITNTAVAIGQPPTGPAVSEHATVTVPADQHPAITLQKTASPTTAGRAGTTITYHYEITNTGNVTLDPVTVADPLPGLSVISCPGQPMPFSLAPGAPPVTCTATYALTQADVDNGKVVNTATATGVITLDRTVHDSSTATVTTPSGPAISVTKTPTPATFDRPGVRITYSYKVTNTGNVTLDPVTVADNRLGAVPCPGGTPLTLAPGASVTCTAAATATIADVDRGSLTNSATATGTPPTGPAVTATGSATVHGLQKPGIDIAKSAGTSGYARPGTTIVYRYLVTNTGNVTLDRVAVTDNLPRLSPISCPATTLAPGTNMTCTATYTTTQADLDAGHVTNNATAHGTAPDGTTVTRSDQRTVAALQAPAVAIRKTASLTSFHSAGTTITYHYQVTNYGNVTLHPVAVTDNVPGLSPISCPTTTLAPGEFMTCTATYTTTNADRSVINYGLAAGGAPNGLTVKARDPLVVLASPLAAPPPAVAPPAPASPATPVPAQNGPETLALTGISLWLAYLAAAAIATGLAMVTATRRRPRR